MSLDLGRRLLATGVIQPGELRRAVFEAIARDRPLVRTLVETSTAVRELLERPLEEPGHLTIRSVVPHPEWMAALPPGLATRLLVVPLRKDPLTGTVDVATVDPLDAHAAAEVAFHLGAPVRLIAAPLAELERALLLSGDRPTGGDRPRSNTAEYEAAHASMPPESLPLSRRPEPSERIEPSEETAVPLVRRARPSALPAPPVATIARASEAPPSLDRARATLAPPTTLPFEKKLEREPPVQMVVDFSAAARQERDEAPSQRSQRTLLPKRPPFPALTPVLEAIDAARDRNALVSALLRGIGTTATCGALFAPRRGRFVGVGAVGDLDEARVRGAAFAPTGACAEAIARGERLGALDPTADRELYEALDLAAYGGPHVLLHPSFLADKAALLLVAFGMGDVIEATRRARVLATAATAALGRLLKR